MLIGLLHDRARSVETVTLVPLGCARLRMSCLPVVSDAADAQEWDSRQTGGDVGSGIPVAGSMFVVMSSRW